MTYAIEIRESDIPASITLPKGRKSQNGLKRTVRTSLLQLASIQISDIPLANYIATNANEYRAYLDVDSNGYKYIPTAEELAMQEEQLKGQYYVMLDKEINRVRSLHGAPLFFQETAYLRKGEKAKAWDGIGSPPSCVAAVAARFGITPLQAKQIMLQAENDMYDKLDMTEDLRDLAKGDIERGDYSAFEQKMAALRAV